jgi:hypothetical protein
LAKGFKHGLFVFFAGCPQNGRNAAWHAFSSHPAGVLFKPTPARLFSKTFNSTCRAALFGVQALETLAKVFQIDFFSVFSVSPW